MFSIIKKFWDRLTKDPFELHVKEHNLKTYERIEDHPCYEGEEKD